MQLVLDALNKFDTFCLLACDHVDPEHHTVNAYAHLFMLEMDSAGM